jgi:hypothetical protein
MLLVGSQALILRGYNLRKPSDFDLFVTPDELKNLVSKYNMPVKHLKDTKFLSVWDGMPVELEVGLLNNSTDVLLNRHYDQTAKLPFGEAQVADLNTLLTLKMSHRYLKNSPFFNKTMEDIKFLRSKGAFVPEELKQTLKLRETETYTYKHPSLKQGKETFFEEKETFYVYDHDSIHRAVALGEAPAYTYYIEDGAEVNCSKQSFYAVSQEIRLRGVLEESYVLALERSQIPFNWEPAPLDSFLKALEKVCTSITSGWFREFAWENYDTVKGMYNPDYIDKFKKSLSEGKILPFTKSY